MKLRYKIELLIVAIIAIVSVVYANSGCSDTACFLPGLNATNVNVSDGTQSNIFRSNVTSFTRDISLTTSQSVITGFKPSSVTAFMSVTGGNWSSSGVGDGTNHRGQYAYNTTSGTKWGTDNFELIAVTESTITHINEGAITFDPTGYTITWTKSGSPVGTANIIIEAKR